MKYLVTGGLGFIGSNMVDYLAEQGHEVTVIDDVSTGTKDNMNRSNHVRYYMYPDGLNHVQQLTDMLKDNVGGVFHFAAWARLQRSIDDPIGTNHANVDGSVSLLEACRRAGIKKVVLSSSSSVYGLKDNPKMKEDMSLNPQHFYALQKKTMEEYGKLFSELFDIDVTVLRYFNVYGPRQIITGDYALVIGKFLRQLKEGKKVTIYGDGEQTRAYTHVQDVIRANMLAMNFKHEWKKFDVFNIGTDVETSINRIADLLQINKDLREYIVPNPRGNFEERRKCADYTKAREILGWIPEVTIEEGIDDLLRQ